MTSPTSLRSRKSQDSHIAELPDGDRLFFFHGEKQHATKGDDPHHYAERSHSYVEGSRNEDDDESTEEDSDADDGRKCCACVWVIDEMLHHKKTGKNVEFRASAADLPLPQWAVEMMLSGRWNTALVLGIYFSPQQAGYENKKLPQVGDEMRIRGDYAMEDDDIVTYLGYLGKTVASCAFFHSYDEAGRTLIYVNLNALTPASIYALYNASYKPADGELWNQNRFNILNFTEECLQHLWVTHGVRERFFGADGLVAQYPGARFVFTGYSHGTPMSQGLALLFSIERERRMATGELRAPLPEAFVIAWNGYRIFGDGGREVFKRYMADHAVILVSVKRWKGLAHYDPTSGFPDNGNNSEFLYAIDVDNSRIEKIDHAPNTSRSEAANISMEWLAMHSIHIKAIRRLSVTYAD